MYFDCPPGLGLACPTDQEMNEVALAIHEGDITWHAFPHNAQYSLLSGSLLRAGLDMTFDLDSAFNQSQKKSVSLRDVPGLTKAMIPLLTEKGVTTVSVGANGASTPADVPPCSIWKGHGEDDEILLLYTWPGYGEMFSGLQGQRPCIVGNLALVYNCPELL